MSYTNDVVRLWTSELTLNRQTLVPQCITHLLMLCRHFFFLLLAQEAPVVLELHDWDGHDEHGTRSHSVSDVVVRDDLVDVGCVGEATGDCRADEEGVVDSQRVRP